MRCKGAILAIVLVFLAIYLAIILGINKLVLSEVRISSTYPDYVLAHNYANAALLYAEQAISDFDMKADLEAGNSLIESDKQQDIAEDFATLRHAIVSTGPYNIEKYGADCNMGRTWRGWCYQSLGANKDYIENPLFEPWAMVHQNSRAPCNSYTQNSTLLPVMDDRDNKFTQIYRTGDRTLCSEPRFIIEPMNLAYLGHYESDINYIYGRIIQPSRAEIKLYQQHLLDSTVEINPARLYRVTVRAFGRSGNTRVTIQEYVVISHAAKDESRFIIPVSIRYF